MYLHAAAISIHEYFMKRYIIMISFRKHLRVGYGSSERWLNMNENVECVWLWLSWPDLYQALIGSRVVGCLLNANISMFYSDRYHSPKSDREPAALEHTYSRHC